MSRRLLAVFLILGSLALLPVASFAYTSDICKSSGDNYCVATDVGPFMDGITKACGNSGTCTLTDIMVVVTNVGNYATGIVGVIVLLMYTIGGFNYLLGGAMPDRVKKGKDMIKISTIGLFIVFFAYVGIHTLRAVLIGGSVSEPYKRPLTEDENAAAEAAADAAEGLVNDAMDQAEDERQAAQDEADAAAAEGN